MKSVFYFVRRELGIREGEGMRSLLMFNYIFLVISSLMIAKPVCSALFLSRFGVEGLPYLFMLVAVMAVAVSRFYSGLVKTVNLFRMIRLTILGAVFSLMIFWGLLYTYLFKGWSLVFFYAWIALFALVSSSQFWILGNTIFNTREAKRLFGFIGAGAIAGGIFGGYLTKILAPRTGSIHLLWICIVFLAMCLPLLKRLKIETGADETVPAQPPKRRKRAGKTSPLRIILNSRHLTLMAGIIAVGVIAGKLAEYQFRAISSAQIPDQDELTAFFGFWLSNINIASFFIQLLLTRRVMAKLGVGFSLFFLPVSLLAGAFFLFLSPVLEAAIFIKLIDGSLKNSINKAGIELMILPVPRETRNQAKAFIDVMVDSVSTGISGLLLIVITDALGFSVRQISIIIFALVGVWIFFAVQARKEYVALFRRALKKRDGPPPRSLRGIREASVLEECIETLECCGPEQAVDVLQMIRDVRSERLIPCFKNLIYHPSPAIRLSILKHRYVEESPRFIAEAEKLTADSDPEVRAEAVRYLFHHSEGSRFQVLKTYLHHEDDRLKGAGMLCLARESRGNPSLKGLFDLERAVKERIASFSRIQDAEALRFAKINSARVIGAARISDLNPYLNLFLTDADPAVVEAAISAAGESGHEGFIPALMFFLGGEEHPDAAAQALKAFGSVIIENLTDYLNNPFADRQVRIRIPRILGLMGTQAAADALVLNLRLGDVSLRNAVIRALNHLRSRFPALYFDDRRIVSGVLAEARDHLNMLTALYEQRRMDNQTENRTEKGDRPVGGKAEEASVVKKAREELIRTLEKRMDENLERIFRLLGLKYPPQEMYDIYQTLYSEQSAQRAGAVEFLENLLETDLKKILIPLIESAFVEGAVSHLLNLMGVKPASEFESMEMLMASGDRVLQLRVLNLISALGSDTFAPLAAGQMASPDSAVREKAAEVLKAAFQGALRKE